MCRRLPRVALLSLLAAACSGSEKGQDPAADTQAPVVLSTAPYPGSTGVSILAAVTATFSEPMDPASVDATTFQIAGISGTVAYDAATRTATLVPAAALPHDTLLVATITTGAKDLAGNGLTLPFSWPFRVERDQAGPRVVSTIPEDGAVSVPVANAIRARFDEPLDPLTVNASTFTVAGIAGAVSYDPQTRTATFTPAEPLPASATLSASLTDGVKDAAGNALAPRGWTFTTEPDRIAPAVTLAEPADGQTGVPQASLVRATFSEPMDASTLNAATFLVESLLGTVSYDAQSRTATFTPLELLPPDATLEVTLTDGVQDLAGNPLAGTRAWSFATGPDVTAPAVTARAPQASATDVGVTAAVTATFSEAMAAATITASTFRLLVAGEPFPCAVTYDAATRTATLVPAAPLPYSTQVGAGLTTAITDAQGLPLAAAVEWTFTTEADTHPPTVLRASPADAATGIDLLAPVYVEFSEPMDPWSFQAGGVEMTGGQLASLYYDEYAQRLWIHHAPFPNDTVVAVSLAAPIADASGNTLPPYAWSFRTLPDTTPPAVVSTLPADGARLAGRDRVEVTFDEAMASASLTEASFRVAGARGTVRYDAERRSATFAPDAPLLPATRYTVELDGSITDLAGNALSPTAFTFQTAGAPVALSTPEVAEQYHPVAAFNAAGDGLALWTVHSGRASLLVASSYSASTGAWSPEEILERYPDSGAPYLPTAPVVSGERFGVLYATPAGGTPNFRVFEAGSWREPAPPTCEGNALFGSDGTFLLVGHPVSNHLRSCFFDGRSWESAVSVESDNAAFSVAVASGGAFTLLTTAGFIKATTVRLRSWTGSAWSEPTTLFTASEGSVFAPTLAANAEGLVAAFTHASGLVDPTPYALYGLATKDGVWTSPTVLGESADASLRGQVAATAGRRMALFNPKGASAALTASFFDGAGWTSGPVAQTSADAARLVTGRNGLLAGWYEGSYFWANVYDGAAWGTPLKLDYTPEYSERVAAVGDTYGVLYNPGTTVKVRLWSSGAWAAPAQLEAGSSGIRGLCLTSRGGELVAFWQASDHARILRSTHTGTWSTPVEQGTGTYPASSSGPRLARAGDTAMAVWQVHGATELGFAKTSVFASLFASGGWEKPVELEALAAAPSVATDGADYVVAFDAWGPTAMRYSPASATWSAPVKVQSTPNGAVPRLAWNGSRFMLAWAVSGDVFVSTSADGLGWSAPENVTAATASSMSSPLVAADGTGFVVLYRSSAAVFGRAWAGGVWSTETSVATLGETEDFDVASNGAGAMVVGTDRYGSVWARSVAGGAWAGLSYFGQKVWAPRVASDGSGYVVTYGPVRRYLGGAWSEDETVRGTAGGVVGAVGGAYVSVALESDGGHASPVASTFAGGAWGSGGLLGSVGEDVSNLVLPGEKGPDAMLLWLQSDSIFGVDHLVASSGG